MKDSKVALILQQTQETLETAEFGLMMVRSADPARRRIGIRNLIVFGRAVTNVLQQLRSVVADFDSWYQPWVERMQADPTMAYFYRLRSEILKQGRLKTRASVHIGHLDAERLKALMPRPPRAKAFFIGDPLGGSGWEIALPNGETQKFYVELPKGIPGIELAVNLHLADAPQALRKVPVQDLCKRYFLQLKALCHEATQRFGRS